MDEPNQWHSHPDPEDELAYMYQQQDEHAGMQQHFAEGSPVPEQQQYYTSPAAMEPTPNPFVRPSHPHHSSTSFPGFGVPALPHLPFGPVAVKNEPGQPSSSSNRILSFGGQQATSTLDFSGAEWPDGIEAVHEAPERRRNTQEHVFAERKRREKMQLQFVALATILPGLTKGMRKITREMARKEQQQQQPASSKGQAWQAIALISFTLLTDKISLLGSTIKYVKHLEEKVKTLEEQSGRRTAEPTVFESKCRISNDSDASSPSRSASGSNDGSSPVVEASIHGDTVLLKICCKERRGVLVMVISELENQGLSIVNTNVLPFTDSFLNITITAKIGEGFSTTVELVKNLTTALRGFT